MFALQIQINGKPKVFPAHEILAHLIRKLKRDAELYLDEPIKYAIATVPAYFDDLQRKFVREAGIHAGLEFLRLISEPVASGIANRIEADLYTSDEGKIVFLDINDATFDVTVSLVEEGIYEVLSNTSVAIENENNVSGNDFDSILLDYVVSTYNEVHGKDVVLDLGAIGRLRFEVGLAESNLLANNSATITIQPRRDTPIFTIVISSTEYQEMVERLFQQILFTLTKALNDAKLHPSEVDALVITGESSRVAKVKPLLMRQFNEKTPVIELVPSEEAFVRGAAKIGRVFTEPLGDICCCLDINPLGLGFEVEGGLFHKLIPRSTIIPTRKSINATAFLKGQSKISLRIFEGERPLTKYNKLIGTIEMDNIALVSDGEGSAFEVLFELDTERTLKVVLKKQSTGREEVILDTTRAQIDYTEVERVIIEAEENFEEDEVERIIIEVEENLEENEVMKFVASLS